MCSGSREDQLGRCSRYRPDIYALLGWGIPTYEKPASVLAEYRRLDRAERDLFRKALGNFVDDLDAWERGGMVGRPRFRAELRVKDVQMRKACGR